MSPRPRHRGSPRLLTGGSSAVVAATALIVLAAQAAFATTPVPVFADRTSPRLSRAPPRTPSCTPTNSLEHPRHFNSYIETTGGGETRINEAGTDSFQASIDGTTVLYSRISPRGADLRLYDVATGERSDPPPRA